MRLVVADTGPLNYLVLIEATELLPKLFEKVFAPEAVRAELLDQDAPAVVRAWAAQPPGWLDVRTVSSAIDDPAWRKLDIGETRSSRPGAHARRRLGPYGRSRWRRRGTTTGFSGDGHFGCFGPRRAAWDDRPRGRFHPTEGNELSLPAGNHGC